MTKPVHEQNGATFYTAFADWLGELQSSPVFCEFLPDTPDAPLECVAFFVFGTVPEVQGVRRLVQVQVCGKDFASAYERAFDLSLKLDSGDDEDLFIMPDGRWAIIRPIAKPRFMGYLSNPRRARFYFEIAVYGEDRS